MAELNRVAFKAALVLVALLFLPAPAFALFDPNSYSQPCYKMATPDPAGITAWQQAAFVALLLGFFVLSIIYMVGFGFNLPMLVAGAKRDMWYLLFIAILAGALYVMDGIMNNGVLPAFKDTSFIDPSGVRHSVNFCSYGATTTWTDLQQHAIEYVVCLRDKNIDYFKTFMRVNFVLGLASSINLMYYILGLFGVGFSPGPALRPMIDTLGYVLYALAMSIAQLKVQEVVLCFSKFYMFTVILPLGIFLSALSFTRSAGGALISLAIGFYIVLPVFYLISEEITYQYCFTHGDCDVGGFEMLGTFMGNARDIAKAMYSSDGSHAAELVNMLMLDGPLGSVVFIIAIASAFMPFFSLLVTVMFIRSFSRFFGAEVDFSAMIKLL